MVKHKAITFAIRTSSQIHVAINPLFPLRFMFRDFKVVLPLIIKQYYSTLYMHSVPAVAEETTVLHEFHISDWKIIF